MLQRASKLTVNDLMEDLIRDNRFRSFIISANTNEQLYEEGIDSLGKSLGPYAKYTEELKRAAGVEYRHVTLKDEGDFYKSFRVFLDSNHDVEISADTIKDSTDLIEKYGKNILGLTEENLDRLRSLCVIILRDSIRARLVTTNFKAA